MMQITAIEITSIPMSTLLANDASQSMRIVKHTFVSLLNSLHSMTIGINASIELMFLSTQSSYVRILLIIRHSGTEEITIQISKAVENIIKSCNYSYSVLETNELDKLMKTTSSITNNTLQAIVKSEKTVTSPFSYSGYYYYADVLVEDNEVLSYSFSSLFESLSRCIESYVSFQLLPTTMLPNENYAFSDLANSLNQLVNGVYTNGQMLQEPYASSPYKTYLHYSQKAGQPIFEYNILIGSSDGLCSLIAAQTLALLQSRTAMLVKFEVLPFMENKQVSRDFFLLPWSVNSLLQQYYRNPFIWGSGVPVPTNLFRLPFLMTTDEASILFQPPIDDGSIPGIRSNRLMQPKETLKTAATDRENIIFGHIKNNAEIMIGASNKAFTQHATIVGVPGTGKTTFAINLLLQFHKRGIPFLAIEPTKKEYRAMIDAVKGLQIFTPGNNSISPFVINPFIPPKGIRIEQYIPSLANAFKAAFSMPEPLDIIFLSAIRRCYTEHGWKDHSRMGDADVQLFGLYEFILTFNKIVATTDYSREVKGNIQSGGTLRLMNLIEQNSNIYDSLNTVPLEDLLTKPTVLELNAIDNEEYKSLLMALVLINICVYAKHNQVSDGQLKNVLLIDEAHVLLNDQKSSSVEKNGGQNTTISAIQNMVAEIRALGTSIIIADQSPKKIGNDIVSNTNIKVAFRLDGKDEREIIANNTVMDESTKNYLSLLETGEAFIYYQNLTQPQLVMTPDIRDVEKIRLDVPDDEISSRMHYWEGNEELLIPFAECKYAQCRSCDFMMRSFADFYASKIVNELGTRIKNKDIFIKYMLCLHEIVVEYEKGNQRGFDFMRLCDCTKIRFLRKSLLAGIVDLSNGEKQRLLSAALKKGDYDGR